MPDCLSNQFSYSSKPDIRAIVLHAIILLPDGRVLLSRNTTFGYEDVEPKWSASISLIKSSYARRTEKDESDNLFNRIETIFCPKNVDLNSREVLTIDKTMETRYKSSIIKIYTMSMMSAIKIKCTKFKELLSVEFKDLADEIDNEEKFSKTSIHVIKSILGLKTDCSDVKRVIYTP